MVFPELMTLKDNKNPAPGEAGERKD